MDPFLTELGDEDDIGDEDEKNSNNSHLYDDLISEEDSDSKSSDSSKSDSDHKN